MYTHKYKKRYKNTHKYTFSHTHKHKNKNTGTRHTMAPPRITDASHCLCRSYFPGSNACFY